MWHGLGRVGGYGSRENDVIEAIAGICWGSSGGVFEAGAAEWPKENDLILFLGWGQGWPFITRVEAGSGSHWGFWWAAGRVAGLSLIVPSLNFLIHRTQNLTLLPRLEDCLIYCPIGGLMRQERALPLTAQTAGRPEVLASWAVWSSPEGCCQSSGHRALQGRHSTLPSALLPPTW